MHYVTEAKYIKDYKISITFENNESGVIDLEEVILQDKRPIFQELKDKEKFGKIRVDIDTVAWSNGLDLAPEFLHDLLIKQKKMNFDLMGRLILFQLSDEGG